MAFSPLFTYRFVVPASAIDANGHVNNLRTMEWMIDAAMRHSASVGCDHAGCLEAGGTWFARSHHIDYLQPAFEGDELEMRTWLEEVRGVRALRRYLLLRPADGAEIARGETLWVFIDSERQTPRRIPKEVSDRFRSIGD
ncbi:acyl-CoA thioesterase [Nitratifractor sp.]